MMIRKTNEIREALTSISDCVEKEMKGKVYFSKFGDTEDYVITWVDPSAEQKVYHRQIVSLFELETIAEPLAIGIDFVNACKAWAEKHAEKKPE